MCSIFELSKEMTHTHFLINTINFIMEGRNIKKAEFIGAEWFTGKKALEEARKITENFTLEEAPILGCTSYSFRYTQDTVLVYYNPS